MGKNFLILWFIWIVFWNRFYYVLIKILLFYKYYNHYHCWTLLQENISYEENMGMGGQERKDMQRFISRNEKISLL